MMELFTKYLGLDLKSPIIAGSCTLTDSVANLKALEEAGAGAVILKSVFEEEIYLEYTHEMGKLGAMENNLEFLDYYDYEIRRDNLKRYLTLITEAKSKLTIPVIASINCVTSHEWITFAHKIESAGADAIELNLFVLPSNLDHTSQENERIYFDVIRKVCQQVKIPVSVKISYYFSNLGRMVKDISETGIKGVTMFNRFYSPDIDIENESVKGATILSNPSDYLMPLRWIGIMANHVKCDLSASTGVQDWQTVVKLLLSGAQTVQVVSALYKQGFKSVTHMNDRLQLWMEQKKYSSVDEFRGKLALGSSVNPSEYERVQFMKTFGEYHREI